MLIKDGDRIIFREGNQVLYSLDFNAFRGVPTNIVFKCQCRCGHITLIAPGYGAVPYGNGGLLVSEDELKDFDFVEDSITLEENTVDYIEATGEIWRHKKTGGLYEIIAVGIIEADHTACIVYQSFKDGVVWVRPRLEFYGGRFEKVS